MENPSGQDPSFRPVVPSIQAAGLWGAYYWTLFFHLSLLAALVNLPGRMGEGFSPQPGARLAHWIAPWIAAFLIIAAAGRVARVLIHDLLVGFTLRERVGVGFFVFAGGAIPFLIPYSNPVREALLWITPAMLLIAVTPSLARRLLSITLAAGWIAAFWVREPFEFLLLLFFSGSWFFSLGMTRLAFTADEYGVWGGRPVRRLAQSTLGLMIPAVAAAALALNFWPAGMGLNSGTRPAPGPNSPIPPPAPSFSQLPRQQVHDLLQQLLVFMGLLMATVILMILIRRWLLRRRKGALDFGLLPGQAAELEYENAVIEPRRPAPEGLRGSIVRLWGRWEAAMTREELARQAGETADEFAARLAADSPPAKPPAEVTQLLDQAHYGPREPTPSDVAAMSRLVEEELKRQAQRRQALRESGK